MGEINPDDLDEETLFLLQDSIAEAMSKIEQDGRLDEALKKLSPEEATKVRTMVNKWIQWRKNRTIN